MRGAHALRMDPSEKAHMKQRLMSHLDKAAAFEKAEEVARPPKHKFYESRWLSGLRSALMLVLDIR